MYKDTFMINQESLLKLGISVQEGIDYLENKPANSIAPAHVKTLHILKQSHVARSS